MTDIQLGVVPCLNEHMLRQLQVAVQGTSLQHRLTLLRVPGGPAACCHAEDPPVSRSA